MADILESPCKKRKVDLDETINSTVSASEVTEAPLDWQIAYLNKLKREDTDRKIFWLWSANGNASESLRQHLSETKEWVWLPSTLKSVRAKIGSALKQCKPRRDVPGIVVDLPEPPKRYAGPLYAAIEEMKRGKLYDSRRGWKTWRINPPAVLILANVPPLKDMMSVDKLVVTHLDSFIDGVQSMTA